MPSGVVGFNDCVIIIILNTNIFDSSLATSSEVSENKTERRGGPRWVVCARGKQSSSRGSDGSHPRCSVWPLTSSRDAHEGCQADQHSESRLISALQASNPEA